MRFTTAEAEERRALVRELRSTRGGMMYQAVEARVIPCCRTCRYNLGGTCIGGTHWDTPTGRVQDGDYLCLSWAPSPPAFLRAFIFTFPIDLSSLPAPHRPATRSRAIAGKQTLSR